jgi:hypothetical protein
MSHAYDIAKELGEQPPESGLIFGFVEDFFWLKVLETADKNQSRILKKYIFYHKILMLITVLGATTLFMMLIIKSSGNIYSRGTPGLDRDAHKIILFNDNRR